MKLEHFTPAETQELLLQGYVAGWMKDVIRGDFLAIGRSSSDRARVMFGGPVVPILLLQVEQVYIPTDEDEVEQILFIAYDYEDGLPGHYSYDPTYPCYIKKET